MRAALPISISPGRNFNIRFKTAYNIQLSESQQNMTGNLQFERNISSQKANLPISKVEPNLSKDCSLNGILPTKTREQKNGQPAIAVAHI
jgi:hypothetical protein